MESRVDLEKPHPPNVGFGVGPLPSAKHKWHIDNALEAKITAGVVYNGKRGFHMHIVWLYNSSISQSYTVLPVLAVYVQGETIDRTRR